VALPSVKKANSEAKSLPRISAGAERRRSCVEKTHSSPLPHPTIIDAIRTSAKLFSRLTTTSPVAPTM
jgi:hypothetical protein